MEIDIPLVVTEAAIVPLAMGTTELAKRTVPRVDPYAPVVSWVLAIAFTFAVRQELSMAVALAGFAYGLMANGLFSATKALARI